MQESEIEARSRLWRRAQGRGNPIVEPSRTRRIEEESSMRIECGGLRRMYGHLRCRVPVGYVDNPRTVLPTKTRVLPQ